MTIVIVNLFGIGNTLLLLPFLRNLRKIYPQGKVVMVVTQSVVRELLESQGLVDEFIFYRNDLNPRKSMFKGPVHFIRYVKEMLNLLFAVRKTHLDLHFMLEPLNVKTAFFTLVSRAKIRVGFAGNPRLDWVLSYKTDADKGMHEVEWYLNLLRSLGYNVPYEQPYLILLERMKKKWKQKFAKVRNGKLVVGLHPGCSMALKEKRWPTERYTTLIRLLKTKAGVYPVLFGGPDDQGAVDNIVSHLDWDVSNYVNQLSITETASAIANCDAFISNDSGLMHLAAALEVPVIALFGSTNVTKNKPLTKTRVLIDGNRLDGCNDNPIMNITVNHVLNACKSLMEMKKEKS